jgi:hypothetical protein
VELFEVFVASVTFSVYYGRLWCEGIKNFYIYQFGSLSNIVAFVESRDRHSVVSELCCPLHPEIFSWPQFLK